MGFVCWVLGGRKIGGWGFVVGGISKWILLYGRKGWGGVFGRRWFFRRLDGLWMGVLGMVCDGGVMFDPKSLEVAFAIHAWWI